MRMSYQRASALLSECAWLSFKHANHDWRLTMPALSLLIKPASGKAILRKLAVQTSEAVDEAIRIVLESITPADAAGWLASCGYILS